MQLNDLLSFSRSHLLTLLILRVHLYYVWLFQMPVINNCCDSLAVLLALFPQREHLLSRDSP